MGSDKFLPVYEPDLGGNELAYVSDCIRSGWVSSLGEYVQRFEEGFARFCGVEHAVSVANGTAALHLALVALGIGPGDEVLIPTLTFVATANAVGYTGATPVFVDSERSTWNMDPEQLAGRITPRTRAIVPVHLYGHPAAMGPILDVAKRHGLYVVEDAAEAHGAEYMGKRVGSLGHVGCFSFYGNKVITTGEGGMITTSDGALAERIAFLKDHSMAKDKRYWHPEIGFNYRLTNLQAALGVAQMERVEQFIQRKRESTQRYSSLLAGVKGVKLPPKAEWARSVYWMYSILIEDEFGMDRDELMARLRQVGVDTRPFFHPIHRLPPYQRGETLAVAEDLSRRGVNLPSSATLGAKDVERVAKAIADLQGGGS